MRIVRHRGVGSGKAHAIVRDAAAALRSSNEVHALIGPASAALDPESVDVPPPSVAPPELDELEVLASGAGSGAGSSLQEESPTTRTRPARTRDRMNAS